MIEIRLKELLSKKNKTMADLSRETGISKNALSQLANGESQGIHFKTLEKIASYLNCSFDDLLKNKCECDYCGRREKDLARIDLEDEDNSFAYVSVIENQMRLSVETDYWDDDVRIEAKYCPMCGRELKEE